MRPLKYERLPVIDADLARAPLPSKALTRVLASVFSRRADARRARTRTRTHESFHFVPRTARTHARSIRVARTYVDRTTDRRIFRRSIHRRT